MDVGPKLFVTRNVPRDGEGVTPGDLAVHKDQESVITMRVGTSISRKALLHLLTELIHFLLYMHQQMPCTYEELQLCCSEQTEAISTKDSESISRGPLSQRRSRGKDRREASDLKKLLKLKAQIEKVIRSLEECLSSLPDMRSLLIILGASPTRPKQIYQVYFHCQVTGSCNKSENQSKEQQKTADLSRKLIRALISDGAASSSEGSLKLFIVVQASASSAATPEDFHPKRQFVYKSKKVVKTSIHLTQQQKTNLEDEVSSISLLDPSPPACVDGDGDESATDDDHLWYQCRHSVKGLFEGNMTDVA